MKVPSGIAKGVMRGGILEAKERCGWCSTRGLCRRPGRTHDAGTGRDTGNDQTVQNLPGRAEEVICDWPDIGAANARSHGVPAPGCDQRRNSDGVMPTRARNISVKR